MYQKPAAGLANSVGFVLTDIVPYDRLNVPDPITVGIDAIGMRWLAPLIKLGVILRLTSVILLGQSRVFYAMAPGPGVRQGVSLRPTLPTTAATRAMSSP